MLIKNGMLNPTIETQVLSQILIAVSDQGQLLFPNLIECHSDLI